jgi:HD-GYP domain-containing protein (c-di-GMP phosphodiesterase class II)
MLLELWNRRSRSSPRNLHTAAVEDLYFQALSQMGQKIVEKESDRLTELLQESHKLEVIRDLLFTLNLPRQMDVLARRIPDMGIETCYVSLYKSNPPEAEGKSVCMLGVRGRKRIAVGPEGVEFATKQLVPDDFFTDHRQHMVIVEAMKQFGYIVFESGNKPNRFFAYLSDIISGAVQGALLYQALEGQKNDLDRNLERTRKAMGGFIRMMSAAVETREPFVAGHQRRVSDLARTIAQEMDLPAAQIEGVRMAGAIHDLGKIYIPAEILNRAGALDDAEWGMIKKHPKAAWDVLKTIDFPWPLAEIVHQHHERINGKGYPNGLKGKTIRLEARILAVADVVEAMSSRRPHREALGIEKALEEINQHKGILYDPQVVEVCTALFRHKGFKFRTTGSLALPARKS